MALFDITRWPTAFVFLLAGAVAAVFAFVTASLFTQAMGSLRLLREFGGLAVQHGALWQVLELLFWGCLALSCWVVFKICEQELEDRYFAWTRKARSRRKMSSKR